MHRKFPVLPRLLAVAAAFALALPLHAAVLVGQLQISELMADSHAPGDLDGEWIELRNATASVLDLGTIRLQDAAGNFFEMPSGRTLGGNEFFLFTRVDNVAINGIVIEDYVYSGALSLNNPGDTLSLFSDGLLIDSVSYGLATAGVSFNFTDDGTPYKSTQEYDPINHYFGSPRSANEIMAAIPEPETYALLLAGLGLLGFAARRKKQS